MFDIAVLDMAEPDAGFAMFPAGAAEELLLSLEAGAAEEGFESGGAAGLLQPSKAKDK
jgi:hypothetical protein